MKSNGTEDVTTKRAWWIVTIEILAVPLCIGSLGFAYCGFGCGFAKDDPVKVAQALVLCFWVLIPPMWFSLERWERRKELKDDGEFARFKYNQDLASKIWLALVSVLLVLYFGKDLVHR
jgi:hypothetical protein